MYVLSIVDGSIFKITPKNTLSPLKQYNSGVPSFSIVCKQELMPILKNSGSVACVTPKNALILHENGWILEHPNMPAIDLKNQNLDGLNFSNLDLSKSNFSNVDFRMVEISNVNFSQVNLSYTDLSGKDLTGANLNCFNHSICT